ncbi:uncharacterized protein LOC133195456 isoform X3 [Saccostrea echinata]|uniref:uncharacterized protein LOC133195456 isoform X3 n=1 Tax=Saccostrea echinata TaxID=191078 RepID=UPI002A836730|nr:uncharacterized protein LOC133195456 isoform X3 [Saccostrea echinata]
MGPKKKYPPSATVGQRPTKKQRTSDSAVTNDSSVIQSLTQSITANILSELKKVGVLPTVGPQEAITTQVPHSLQDSNSARATSEENVSEPIAAQQGTAYTVPSSPSSTPQSTSAHGVTAQNTAVNGAPIEQQLPAATFVNLAQQLQGSRIQEVSTGCTSRTNHGASSVDASELLDNIAKLTTAAIAPSTTATYNRAWRVFTSFCISYNIPCVLPLTSSIVALFVAHLFSASFSPKSISTYLSALGYVHKILNYQDPTQAFLIQKLIAGAYRLGNTFDIRLPITNHILDQLVSCLPQVVSEENNQKMFRALFLFAFSAFARIGELVGSEGHYEEVIQLSDVTFTCKAGKAYQVNVCFKTFKHNSSGVPKFISFSHGDCKISAVEALLQYLNIRKNITGPLFLLDNSLPLTRVKFNHTLKKCLLLCGLDSSKYKGHSFRIGAATAAAFKGCTDTQIRSMGRWQSNAFQKYIRSNHVPTSE